MPTKYRIKTYVENGYYHVYNRGVEKRIIFNDEQDYNVFLKYLKEYLLPPPDITQGRTLQPLPRLPKNYNKRVDLVAYCLMPNHFHFLIKQVDRSAMEDFMRSLLTRYSMFFNKKYDRVGSLFQGRYKAILINNDDYLLHLTRYIHRNVLEIQKDLESPYSSYLKYIGKNTDAWLKCKIILDNFQQSSLTQNKNINSYESFAKASEIDSADVLGNHTLD